MKDDIRGVMYMITKASNISSLAIGTGTLRRYGDNRYVLEAYHAIAEHRTYPINFKDLHLVIPPTPRESNQSMATQECMEQLLKFYCENGSETTLDAAHLDELTVDALAETTKNGSEFKELYLRQTEQLGDAFINNLSSILGRSELNYIEIWMRYDSGRVRILESIQWKHLRRLIIQLAPGTFETRVMQILVDGVTKMSEKVELDTFRFEPETRDTSLTLPEGDLLRDFVSSASIERLELKVEMTLEQILSLLKLTDFSRLETLVLWAKDFDSVKVDAVLDGLQHASKLDYLRLIGANITKEQYRRIKPRGVTLERTWL
jgi:hypothetical protein